MVSLPRSSSSSWRRILKLSRTISASAVSNESNGGLPWIQTRPPLLLSKPHFGRESLALFSTSTTESAKPTVTGSAYPRPFIIQATTDPVSSAVDTDETLRLPIIVMKMGGSSLGNADAMNRSAHIVYNHFVRGVNVVVVVSALYGVTNKLEQACLAKSMEEVRAIREELRSYHMEQAEVLLSDSHSQDLQTVRKQIDDILATYFDPGTTAIQQAGRIIPEHFNVVSGLGERIAVPLFTAVVSSLGVPAAEVYTENLILKQNLEPHSMILMAESHERVRKTIMPLLKRGKTPIVTGFIAGTPSGNITTLGRGGSDLTATFVASAINANEVNLWKVESVDFPNGFMKDWQSMAAQHRWTGIRSADPKQVDGAQIVPTLSYNEATELAHFGKKVLHPQTMVPLVMHQIPLFVRNTSRPSHAGTMIGHVEHMQLWSQGDYEQEEPQCSALVSLPLKKYVASLEQTEAVKKNIATIRNDIENMEIKEPLVVALVGPSLASYPHFDNRVQQALRSTPSASPSSSDLSASPSSSSSPPLEFKCLIPNDAFQTVLGSIHSFTIIIDTADEKQIVQALHNVFVLPTLQRLASSQANAAGSASAANGNGNGGHDNSQVNVHYKQKHIEM